MSNKCFRNCERPILNNHRYLRMHIERHASSGGLITDEVLMCDDSDPPVIISCKRTSETSCLCEIGYFEIIEELTIVLRICGSYISRKGRDC